MTSESESLERLAPPRTLYGFIRIVSEKEAGIALRNNGMFLSNEFFEVFDGRLPPNAYCLNTARSYRADQDYRKVLFFTPSSVSSDPKWMDEKGERYEHPNYDIQKYPAVSLSSLSGKRFKKGQIVNLTDIVRERMQEKDPKRNPNDYEQLLDLSRRTIIDTSGRPLEHKSHTVLSLSKILRLGK